MSSNIKNLICNKFVGLRRKNTGFSSSFISAKDMQNVELFDTGIASGVGIKTTSGNVSIGDDLIPTGEEVVNIFESIQGGVSYLFIHTVSATEGKVYLYDSLNQQLIQKISGLAKTSVSYGADFAQGNSDLFIFANGVDWLYTIEIGATTEVNSLQVQDSENNDIKGKMLEVYDGRLWTCVGKRLHWCVQANINDWSTSNINVSTSAGFVDFVKDITAIKPYLSSLAVFFKDSSLLLTGTYPYSASDESPGGCVCATALVFHGTDLYFYDHTKKGLFSFKQVILGNRTLGDDVACEIHEELDKIDETKSDEIKIFSVIMENRNEIWFYLPTTDTAHSTIMIYDSLHNEWIKRVSNKVKSFCIYNGNLYSAYKKIYKELQGKTFDGTFIQSYYKCTPCNLGSNTTIKAMYYEPRLIMGTSDTNNFWIKYSKNFDYFKPSKTKNIKSKYKNFLIWDEGIWNVNFWNVAASSAVTRLPRISTFKALELEIYNTAKEEDFCIKSLEFNEIEIYQA